MARKGGDDGQIEGRYANYFTIGFDRDEFLLDFGQSFSEEATPAAYVRIITTPGYAQILQRMLGESLVDYEKEFGPIRPVDESGLK